MLDPNVLASIIPGCTSLDQVGDDHYTGVVEVRLGFIKAPYSLTFKIRDRNPYESYRLLVSGDSTAGTMNGDLVFTLVGGGEGTELQFDGTVDVDGPMQYLGALLIEAGVKLVMKQGFAALKSELQDER